MILEELLKNLSYTLISGSLNKEVSSLVYDSRKVTTGSAFVCIKGSTVDGHTFLNEVIQKGVSVIILQDEIPISSSVTVIKVPDTRLALAELSANWFRHPAKKLVTIGVTGTKGKTTTTYMIREILLQDGKKTGLIGTIEIIIGDTHVHALNTTPESYLVQEYFAKMVEAGCTHVVMEVSSQALMMNRVSGFTFDYGIFTNIEPDHIGPNEHKDFEDYLHCKSLLFQQCKTGIFNVDAAHGKELSESASCAVKTFSLSDSSSDFIASNVNLEKTDASLGVKALIQAEKEAFEVHINMPGYFSIYNALGSIAVTKLIGVQTSSIQKALSRIRVNGRVEIMPVSNKFTVIIDYAHNAMGLKSLLTTLKQYQPKRLITIFGCGGNRDKKRRFEMGEVSSLLSDLTVITSDNPRYEKPTEIIDDIVAGVKKADGNYIVIPDRIEAIRETIRTALPNDVIIVAGKGHEDYQEIEGVKHHMDDHETVMNAL